MYEELKKENVADYNRRVHQAEVLKMDAKRLSKTWTIDESLKAAMKKNSILKKLNESELVEGYTEKGILQGFGTFVCGASSQKGYYSTNPMKENQDSFDIRIADDTQNHFFGVFDGHGKDGGRCSQLCKAKIGDIYEEQLSEGSTAMVSMTKAHTETHDIMTKSAAINAELSGSTTVIACLRGRSLTIAHAGGAEAIIGSKSNRRTPMYLTNPHDLSRPDEVARIEEKGGLVMSTEEYDDLKGQMTKKRSTLEARPGKKNNVPRIWSATSAEKVPGVAFTRSLGDIVAHGIGVSEKPDFKQLTVQDDDVIVIASDGVTECKSRRYSMFLEISL